MAKDIAKQVDEATFNENSLKTKLSTFTEVFKENLISLAKVDGDFDASSLELLNAIDIGSTVEQEQSIISVTPPTQVDISKITSETIAQMRVELAQKIFIQPTFSWEQFLLTPEANDFRFFLLISNANTEENFVQLAKWWDKGNGADSS